MLEQRIEQQFIDSADLKYQAAQVLSKPMAAAIQSILVSVTGGGKVLACGKNLFNYKCIESLSFLLLMTSQTPLKTFILYSVSQY